MLTILAAAIQAASPAQCSVELVVLGVSQDGGTPQVNVQDDPAWEDESLRRRVVSLGVVNHVEGTRYMFEATPDFREQMHDLNQMAGTEGAPDGVFLTHAHIGHYTGLMFLGFESMSASEVPVHTLPLMAEFLSTNGPWDQLLRYENIDLQVMAAEVPLELTENLSVSAWDVPHRREYAETAGFRIQAPELSVVFIPDIDSWEEWAEQGIRIEDVVMENDVIYVDATFFDDNELPGRDMSAIPHPRVSETMDLFQDYPDEIRQRIRFIHYNHTNPIRYPDSDQAQEVWDRGYRIAEEGERLCL
jgi:pyrroloquinoline quinone biosynthesis protein B